MQDAETQESHRVSEQDMVLANALQRAPRASWSDLGDVLGVHATTLARRWERMVGAGLARVTLTAGPGLSSIREMAFVELECANGHILEVAEAMAQDARLMTVQFVAGTEQLLLTVTASEAGFTSFLLERLAEVPHVTRFSVRTMTAMLFLASRWHFRALPPSTLRRLDALAVGPGGSGAARPDMDSPAIRGLVSHLHRDGRAPLRELAQITGTTPATAGRRVAQLMAHGFVTLRCDVARVGTGRERTAVIWGRMDPAHMTPVRDEQVANLPELRLMLGVTGPSNVHIVVWLNDPSDLLSVERRLVQTFPGLTLHSRRLVLKTFKFNGVRMLADGRFGEPLPMEF